MSIKNFIYSLLLPGGILAGCSEDSQPLKTTQQDDCLTTRSSSNGTVVAGQYIVSFAEPAGSTGGRAQATAARVFQHHNLQEDDILKTFTGENTSYVMRLSDEAAQALQNDETVTFIEPDRIVSLCACFTVIEPTLVTWNIDRVGYGDGTGKTAWLLDTGIDFTHEDLVVDTIRSKSFLEEEPSAQDKNGHGTHVAGIIGAKNNRVGTLGVASGATLVALKVLNEDGDGLLSNVLDALAYVRRHAVAGEAVNISLGLNERSLILEREIQGIANNDIYVTLAAGNESKPARDYSPASTNGKNIFTVSAVDSLNHFASFSNYGNEVIDVAAPGVRVLSSYIFGRYAIMSGTSMASPHVTGLLLINNGKLNSSGTALHDPDGTGDPLAHK